jgi:hypothetical protein
MILVFRCHAGSDCRHSCAHVVSRDCRFDGDPQEFKVHISVVHSATEGSSDGMAEMIHEFASGRPDPDE